MITTNAQAIASEASRAQGVESSLQNQIDFITSNTDSAALDSLTEIVAALQSGDGVLLSLIQTNQTDIATNASDISTEATTRASADASMPRRATVPMASISCIRCGWAAKALATIATCREVGA